MKNQQHWDDMRKDVAVNEEGRRIGEDHPHSKLTDEQCEKIRDLREDHELSYKQIAAMFGVSKNTIASICQYRRRAQTPFGWKTLPTNEEDEGED